MENASKALLIAGAILIAILLIGIAMMVFGNINGLTGMAGQQVDQMDMQAFNSRFKQYEGDYVSGSNVKALIENIKSNNATYANDVSRIVKVYEGTGTADVLSTFSPKSNYRYKVKCEDNDSGYVEAVRITKVTKP